MDNTSNDKLASVESEAKRKQKKIDQAEIHTNCFASAAMTLNNLHGHGRVLDCPTVMSELIKSAKRVTNGNITEIEQMLMTQAKTLDYIFYDALGKLVDVNMINQIQVFTDIAFRSQAQCRKTLAVLAELKHPRRTTFIKQQNNQQINNAVKIENPTILANKVVSEVCLEKMDSRGTIDTISINTATTPVGAFNRPKNA